MNIPFSLRRVEYWSVTFSISHPITSIKTLANVQNSLETCLRTKADVSVTSIRYIGKGDLVEITIEMEDPQVFAEIVESLSSWISKQDGN